MLVEQAPELTLAHAEPRRQGFDVAVIERAGFDQAERARDGVGTAAPEGQVGRGLRPAAQTGAKAGFLRRGGGGEEEHVLALRRRGRAERPAIDAGRRDRNEQAAIEPTVPGFDRAVTGVIVHVHVRMMAHGAGGCLAVFGRGRHGAEAASARRATGRAVIASAAKQSPGEFARHSREIASLRSQ